MASRSWEARLLELERVLNRSQPSETPSFTHSSPILVSRLPTSDPAINHDPPLLHAVPALNTKPLPAELTFQASITTSGDSNGIDNAHSPDLEVGSQNQSPVAGTSQSAAASLSTSFSPVVVLKAPGDAKTERDETVEKLQDFSAEPLSRTSSQRAPSTPQNEQEAKNLPSAVANVLAQAVSQAVSRVEAWQRRAEHQARLLTRVQSDMAGRMEPELEALIGQALGGGSAEGRSPSLSPRSPGNFVPASLRLGPAAVELLHLAGWGTGIGDQNSDVHGVTSFPFSDGLITAVALAHAGRPDRLCAQLIDTARTARQVRLETQLLRSVVDQVRAEHGRRMRAVEEDRAMLAARIQELEGESPPRRKTGGSGRVGIYPSTPVTSPRSKLPSRQVESSPPVGTSRPSFNSSPHVGFESAAPAPAPRAANPKTPFPASRIPSRRRPASAGPRLAGLNDKSSTFDAGTTPHPPRNSGRGLEQLRRPEAASPPVALKRGTGLGAGGGKLLQATQAGSKNISAALLRAIGGGRGTKFQKSDTRDSAAARGRTLERMPHVSDARPVSVPARARLSKSLAPAAQPKADPSAVAAARIRQYRASRSQGGTRVSGRRLLEQSVGTSMFLALGGSPRDARSSATLPSPIANGGRLSPYHWQDSSTTKMTTRDLSPAGATLTLGNQRTEPSRNTVIPDSLIAVLDRLRAKKA